MERIRKDGETPEGELGKLLEAALGDIVVVEHPEDKYRQSGWFSVERPGYLGKRKDGKVREWNEKYGDDNWKLIWETALGEEMAYEDVFWKVYVPGYVKYFLEHPEEAEYLTKNFSYAYDKDLISRKDAFDPHALFEKPGFANQFHHVSLNIALEYFLGKKFKGVKPIQIRAGKPGTDLSTWPLGWKWHPGRIPAVMVDLIPDTNIEGKWPWEPGSIEDFYQKAKVLQVRST